MVVYLDREDMRGPVQPLFTTYSLRRGSEMGIYMESDTFVTNKRDIRRVYIFKVRRIGHSNLFFFMSTHRITLRSPTLQQFRSSPILVWLTQHHIRPVNSKPTILLPPIIQIDITECLIFESHLLIEIMGTRKSSQICWEFSFISHV